MKICVPATSANLGPGFDTLGIALKLKNCVDIQPSNKFRIIMKGSESRHIRQRKNELFFKIYNRHQKSLSKQSNRNLQFTFYNNIPISRGLGSSSAVIVSAIASACSVAGFSSLQRSRILNSALEYEHHPDNITPAVVGGFTVAVLERNRVYYKKKNIPPYLKAVIVVPHQNISTAKSRTTLPNTYSKEDAIFNISHSSFLTASFFNEDWDSLRIASKDRFHQVQRMKQLPELFRVQKIALENGALMSTLSGSGSSFFNMVYQEDTARLVMELQHAFPSFRILVLDFDNDGVQVFHK